MKIKEHNPESKIFLCSHFYLQTKYKTFVSFFELIFKIPDNQFFVPGIASALVRFLWGACQRELRYKGQKKNRVFKKR